MSVVIEGLDETRQAFRQLERDLHSATGEAVVGAIDAGRDFARTQHRYQARSPDGLEASTGAKIVSVTDKGTTGELFAKKPYATFVDEGTRPHPIESPVHIEGVGWRYIIMHPGTNPDPFMTGAREVAEHQLEVLMERATDRACEKV